MEKYYLPISSECLAHYLSSALISPSGYINKRPNDIQSSFSNVLLITSINGVRGADCSLELVLTENEVKSLKKISSSFCCFQNSLPITRIKKVFFRNEQQRKTTIANINLNTAYFPKELVSNENITLEVEIPKYNDSSLVETDLSESIRMFDRRLGAFAILKLSGESYMNYSEKYFSILSIFNSVINDEIEIARKKVDSSLIGIFSSTGKWGKYLMYLNKEVKYKDIEDVANIENQKIKKEKITKKIIIDSLKGMTHILAILYSYGVANESRRLKIGELLLSNFRNNIHEDSSETIALCYGYNRGYSVFNKEYKTDTLVAEVKFKMNSQIDYYTIESLYQHTFNKGISGEFPYIDSWCPKLEIPKRKNAYMVLDEVVTCKKKPQIGSKKYLQFLFQKIKDLSFDKSIKEIVEEIVSLIKVDLISEKEEIVEIIREKLDSEYKLLISEKECKIKDLESEFQILSIKKSENLDINNVLEKSKEIDIHSEEKIIDDYIRYNKKKKEDLINEATFKGIKFNNKINKDQLIRKIIFNK